MSRVPNPSDSKLECPACGLETVRLARSFRNGGPCPNCGLPYAVLKQIYDLRVSMAGQIVAAQLEKLLVENDKLKTLTAAASDSESKWRERAVAAEAIISAVASSIGNPISCHECDDTDGPFRCTECSDR